MMTEALYTKVSSLTPEEIEAARAYYSESGWFHLLSQGAHNMVLSENESFMKFHSSGKLAALRLATSERYQLTRGVILYSGHGSGVGIVGSLATSNPEKLAGLTWKYRGFTSTSSCRSTAEHFVTSRKSDTPVLLEFHLPARFRLLPMAVLGPDCADEKEFLLPPNSPFEITSASLHGDGVLHVVLGRHSEQT